MDKIYVHTMGDSTLDNLYWLLDGNGRNVDEASNNCVEGKLQTKLGDKYVVESHAYDGFTTRSLLASDTVGRVLAQAGAKAAAYLDAKGGAREVRPLDQLETSIQKTSNATHFVVLSVGGNDFREQLRNPLKLIADISQVQMRYLQIIDRIQQFEAKDGGVA